MWFGEFTVSDIHSRTLNPRSGSLSGFKKTLLDSPLFEKRLVELGHRKFRKNEIGYLISQILDFSGPYAA